MAVNIASRRDQAGLVTQLMTFPAADHDLSGHGYLPGSAADAEARAIVWAALVPFLERALGQ